MSVLQHELLLGWVINVNPPAGVYCLVPVWPGPVASQITNGSLISHPWIKLRRKPQCYVYYSAPVRLEKGSGLKL